jgi:hypothetical protein
MQDIAYHLPMSARKHWNVGVIFRNVTYCLNQFIHDREYGRVHCFFKHQSMGKIIDVFRCACKMKKLKHLQ